MEELKTRCKTKPQVYITKKNEKRNIVKQGNAFWDKDGTLLQILIA